MAEGGFLIRFDGKDAGRGYACSFDYDKAHYKINNEEPKGIPDGTKKIEIVLEGA